MRIVVCGTGFVGSALVREFTARGHEVTAVSRRLKTSIPEGVTQSAGSVHDPAFLEEVAVGADVLVSALPAIADGGGLDTGVAALLRRAGQTGARLGVVGGSAVLPLFEGGPRQVDTPGFPAWLLPRVEVHARTLGVLDAAPEGIDWFCLVPAADFGPHRPGVRTGSYRTSATAQVTDEQGHSMLGVEDYAIAFADEIDTPRIRRAWLAVGY
ncbi:NAD-dependent epimerase/dehydratase family protein [Streptomyces sp. 8K308]|uniref:NAD(P)-dependent oxidoreductase n=1 Tax=Streptomyces sp. 8K308 TaxID=2530388 RepID=UPI001048819A|nr:NAD(P)H-binding protein [Streptomyces sp. 8K308]TDC15882.1 NAD-dependent epimerase/dehydratase family protein [Streptomyces sp. 8K308]